MRPNEILTKTVEQLLAENERLKGAEIARQEMFADRQAALSRVQELEAENEQLRNHAPWCNWDHEGPCPAENAPAPDHPVWAENERLKTTNKKLQGRVFDVEVALDRLLRDFSRMPDAGLTAGDPRYAWWYETAESREYARKVLR